jgi:sigma-E factor negative regulatory protein RseC
MIEETAVVKSIENQQVEVLTTRASGCHQCNEADSCSTSVLAKFFGEKEISLRLHSDLLLKSGDKVVLGIEENAFIGLTFLMYFLPLCALLLFAILGQFAEAFFNIDNELPTILFGLSGLVGSYYFIRYLIKSYFDPQKINPVILKKVS